jgi:hypothetical protein
MRSFLTGVLLLVLGTAVSPALAGSDAPVDQATIELNRKANEACYECHTAAAVRKPPRPDLDLSMLKDSRIERETFNPSDHGVMDCRQCHGKGYDDFPHPAEGKTETSPCTECHAAKVLRLEPQFDASVHAKTKGVKEKFTCATCHNAHDSVVAVRLKDPARIVAQDNRGCLECHNSDTTYAKFAPEDEKAAGRKKKRPDIDEIHHWLPNAKVHWNAVRCIDCHTPEVAAGKMVSHEIRDKEKAEKRCLSCHSADTSLRTRLYRHLVKEEQQRLGFTNSVVLANSYVIGATRHPVLDSILIGAALLTLLGVLVHGALRLLAFLLRKGPSQ